MRIDASQLSWAISEELQKFAGATDDAVEHAAKTAAAHAAAELNISSPEKSGDYKRDWAYKRDKLVKSVAGTFRSFVVYNKAHYQLTHLLEHGHKKVLWGKKPVNVSGRVAEREHIKPVETATVKEFEELVMEGIRNAAK